VSYRVRIAPRAAAQIRKASAWWLRHRSKAPDAFAEEVERTFQLICALPGVGERVSHPQHSELRRVLLGRVRYHLYYVVAPEEEAVDVLALWHAARGTGPSL
jgi:plasmid stabilization system protein ParE